MAARKSLVDVVAPEDIGPGATSATAAAATGSGYDQQTLAKISVDQIHVHPKNPRHDATADEEMVASVKESGVLVPGIIARHPEGADPKTGAPRYMMIDGHTRLDAALRAGLTVFPAVIRNDLKTEADQIKAMIITGTQRRQLTPIEEAEGYQLLLDLKVKVADIARDMGVSATTVRERVKLLKLDRRLKDKAHEGQLSIDDALAIAALPAAEQKKVAKYAGTGSFRYELEASKRRTQALAEQAKKVADLKAAGIPEKPFPASESIYSLNDAEHGMTRVGSTFSSDPEDHKGCLAFVAFDSYGTPTVEYVCTNVSSHDEQLDEQRRAAREEQDRLNAERQAREDAEALAQRLRCDALLEAIKPGIKLDPMVAGIIRTFLPTMLGDLDHHIGGFFKVLDIPAEDRWTQWRSSWKDQERAAWARMLQRIEKAKDYELLQLLIAAVLSSTEQGRIGREWHGYGTSSDLAHATVSGYYRLLDQVDWTPTDVDVEFRAIAERNTAEQDAEGAA